METTRNVNGKLPHHQPRGRRRRRGNNRGRGFTTRHQDSANIAPPSVHEPQYLSNSSTDLKNDPLCIDSMLFEGLRLIQVATPNFCCSFDSFLPLIISDYKQLVADNNRFARAISESMYAYYNIMHLWARLLAIECQRGSVDNADLEFLSYFEHLESYKVSNPIHIYLKGIGDCVDKNNKRYSFELAAKPNDNGHFGRISSATHNYYEALPSPYVAWRRILQDLSDNQGIWEIDAIRPNGADAFAAEALPPRRAGNPRLAPDTGEGEDDLDGMMFDRDEEEEEQPVGRNMPTVNLLGWSPAVMLSAEQRETLICAGVVDDASLTIKKYGFYEPLMSEVSNFMDMDAPGNFKVGSTLHEWLNGSMAQLPFLDPSDVRDFHRSHYYCESLASSRASMQMHAHIVSFAVLFGYRIKKNTIEGFNPWACYDFCHYAHVPQDWINNRNDLFAVGKYINYGDMTTVKRCRFEDRRQSVRIWHRVLTE